MNKQEAIEALEKASKLDDAEMAHIKADSILLECLRANGFEEVADKFESISGSFWYA